MNQRITRTIATIALLMSSTCDPLRGGGSVELVVPAGVDARVEFGVRQLRAAFERHEWRVHRSPQRRAAGWTVFIARSEDPLPAAVGDRVQPVAEDPESYSISRGPHARVVLVAGSDPTGIMYGTLDLAEQVDWGLTDNRLVENPLGTIEPTAKSPHLRIRGINAWLTTQGYKHRDSWYWSDAFWNGYFDMMARNRWNFLDLHGPHDLTVKIPDGLPFLVSVPDYPQVGPGPAQTARIRGQLRHIIQMAAARGVHVGYMNYKTDPFIGPFDTGKMYFSKPEQAGKKNPRLPADQVADYTRKAVSALLKELPELWAFGFRIGESGREPDFYKKTYLAALQDAPGDLKVYARTWLADPASVMELARTSKQKVYLEPKYNGEQLGLPYVAALGSREYAPSGAYEDYLQQPRDWEVIWQVRASGTHRLFRWGWPEFCRRLVRNCRMFGGAAGFTLEPMNCYNPSHDYIHNNPATNHSFFDWMYQQQWLWYQVWGRTAYDPDVTDRVWRAEFDRRFGKQAGPHVSAAVTAGSRIVPLIFSYHQQGIDHQHMAPEFEPGSRSRAPRGPSGGPRSWESFLRYGPLDRTAMIDPVRYVDQRLKCGVTGKVTPVEMAVWLDEAATAATESMVRAETAGPGAVKEFQCTKMDIEALAALAHYYAARIRSTMHIYIFRRTYSLSDLELGRAHLQKAVDAWEQLTAVTLKHYAHVPETVRFRSYKARWGDFRKYITRDFAEITEMGKAFLTARRPEQLLSEFAWPHRDGVIIGHLPPVHATPGEPLLLTATQAWADTQVMHVNYRYAPHEPFEQLTMRRHDIHPRTWVATIPPADVKSGRLAYHFDAWSVGGPYGGTLAQRDPYVVRVSHDRAKPVVVHVPANVSPRTESVRLVVDVQDDSPSQKVVVYYRRIPSYYDWVATEMQPVEKGQYEVTLPLTPVGIMYYFEVQDVPGNVTIHPNFMQQTPYYVIAGWAPGKYPGK